MHRKVGEHKDEKEKILVGCYIRNVEIIEMVTLVLLIRKLDTV